MSHNLHAFNFRRSIRLQGYDYSKEGVYFVTLCTRLQTALFGEIVDGEMRLSELGKIVEEEWQHIATVRLNVKLDQYVVMPNHLHGLVFIEDIEHKEISPFQDRERSSTLQAGSLGAIVGQFKVAVTRRGKSRQLHLDQGIWQRNYYDRIVRDEQSLNQLRRYIFENPVRWHEDSLYVE